MKTKLFFMLSAPYSGATLLSIVLNQHPKISSDGEMFPFDIRAENQACSCGQNQIDCDYYHDVAKSMIRKDGKGFDERFFFYVPQYSKFYYYSRSLEGFWLNPIMYRIRNFVLATVPAYKTIDREFLEAHLDFFERSLKYRDAFVYVDGSKSLRRAEFFAERNTNPKFIHLIRDGRAFCCSFLKNKKVNKEHIGDAARFWIKNIKKVELLKQRFPDIETLTVRYNDLCENTHDEFLRMSEFMGVPFDASYLEYNSDDMHIMGNRMRFSFNGEIREDNKWKRYFNDNDIALMNRLMDKYLQAYGFI